MALRIGANPVAWSKDDLPELGGQGLRLAYHHHMGTVVESAADIGRLMAETRPSVGLLLDRGHAAFADADPAQLGQDYGSRIVHVPCKDVGADVAARANDRGMSSSTR